ncbi:hypothetical protein [Flavobacterium sp.]|uniref:hypothetical protein n=1 Tax=Flavobacterium sp. TaxID=239 RepID=UPI00260D397A|nr:hypothetical protein [Flavobacterium sp.]
MDYTYKDSEIVFARHIKANPPHKIWWDFTTIIFDYSDFYFQIECASEIADTQNKSDEAIIGQFTKHLEPYSPGQHTKLVCQDKKVEKLYIARVFLYFTTFKEYSKTEQFLNQVKQKVKTFLTGKKDPFGDVLSKTLCGCEEITCHPKSDEVKNVDPKYSNLIDCGLLVQIDGKCLKAFVESNGLGFHVWDDKYFHNIDELKELAGRYEFIKV